MSDAFDVILGQDWCQRTNAEISFVTNTVKVSDSIGRRVEFLPQEIGVEQLCPIVSAVQLEASLEDQDLLYMVHVTEVEQPTQSEHVVMLTM